MDSKKKRQMEGDHKRREDIDSEDDDDFDASNGIKVYPDGSTFERAPPEELAKRKIFKMKPKNKTPAITTPIPSTLTSNSNSTSNSTSTSTSNSTSSENPFAAFSLAKPAATTSTSNSSNPFANFSFTNPQSSNSPNPFANFSIPTSSLKEEKKEEKKEDNNSDIWICPCCEEKNKQSLKQCNLCMAAKVVEKKKEEKKSETNTTSLFSSNKPVTFNTSTNSSLFSSNTPVTFNTPTTSTNTTNLFGNATGFTFNTSKSDEKKDETKSNDDKWICVCCEQKNELSAKQCSLCFANKPAEKKKEEKKSEINPSSLFSSNTPITFNTPSSSSTNTTNSSLFSSNTPTTFNTTTSSTNTTNTTNLFGNATGFTFNTSKSDEKKDETKSNDDKWICVCCEQKNELSAKQCSLCFANKPAEKKKEEKKSEINPSSLFSSNTPITFNTPSSSSTNTNSLFSSNATGFTFNTSKSDEKKDETKSNDDKWICACCEQKNELSAKQCSLCFANKPAEKKKEEKKEEFKIFDLKPLPSPPKIEDWICPCCDEENLGSFKQCKACLIKRPVENKKEEKKEEINTTSLFSSNTPVTFNASPSTTNSSLFSSNTPVTFNTTTTSTNTTNLFGNATGFTFNTSKSDEKKDETKSNDDKWICVCCEQKNELSAKQCSLCFANKPNK